MVEAQRKIVSFEAFCAARSAQRAGVISREPATVRLQLSPKDIEHRERMLRCLQLAAEEKARTAHQLPLLL